MIPERTIDSLFAIEVLEFVSHALIWSPSNTAGQVDHLVDGIRGIAVPFEVKGIVTDASRNPHRPWTCPIDYAQLASYISRAIPVLYVLPGRPDPFRSPWLRACATDPNGFGHCQACDNSGQSARRWAGQDRPAVKAASLRVRAQPWFAHWCWLISAVDLDIHLRTQGSPSSINVADASMLAVPGADRLCHFLAGVADGSLSLESFGVDASEIGAVLAELPTLEPEDPDDQGRLTVIFLAGSSSPPV